MQLDLPHRGEDRRRDRRRRRRASADRSAGSPARRATPLAGEEQRRAVRALTPRTLAQRAAADQIEHRLQLARRAGQQHHDAARVPAACVDEQARRGAVGIVQHDRPLRHLGLPPVHVRHRQVRAARSAPGSSPRSPRRSSIGSPSTSATTSRVRSSSVGPSPPVRTMTSERSSAWRNRPARSLAIVADDGLDAQVDAERRQPVGEEERIGIGARGSEQLGADGDDFSGARSMRHGSSPAAATSAHRSARFAYTPAIASSAMMPKPPWNFSRRSAGIRLDHVEHPEQDEAGEHGGPAGRNERERHEHPQDFVDHDRTGIDAAEIALGMGRGPRAGREDQRDQRRPRRSATAPTSTSR